MTRRNRIVAAITIAVAAAAYAVVPAGAGAGVVTAELGSGMAKGGGFALDITGTTGNDSLTVVTSGGDVTVSVPAPAEIEGPAECTQDTPQQFTCDSSVGIAGVRAFMGPGGDRVNAKETRKVTNQFGGLGNDTLLGGRKFDFLNGQAGGNDRCKGFRGAETIKKCE